MKVLVALLVLAVVTLSVSESPETLQSTSYECEVGTHCYTPVCLPFAIFMPEATCDQPNPVAQRPVCDFSACYCDAPTVRDESTGKCVNLDECPKKKTVL